MKNSFEGVAMFVRWGVTGLITLIVSLPVLASVSTFI
jgi:hypothetical protein